MKSVDCLTHRRYMTYTLFKTLWSQTNQQKPAIGDNKMQQPPIFPKQQAMQLFPSFVAS